MPDPTKAPPAVEKLTRFDVQRKLGLFAPHDAVTAGSLILGVVTMIFWCIFGSPTLERAMAFGLLLLIVMVAWLIVLVFRVLVFVLDMQADVNLMPETAARIAAAYLSGSKPVSKPGN